MSRLTLIAAPEDEPVELDEAKKHARVFITSDDAYIAELITAARAKFEQETGQFFAEQTWEWSDVPASRLLLLPMRPVGAVVAVTDGNEEEIDSENYFLTVDRFGFGTVEFDSTPTGPLTIQFSVGYSLAPPLAKLAIKSLVAHWYNHREAYLSTQQGDLRAVPASYLSILQNFR